MPKKTTFKQRPKWQLNTNKTSMIEINAIGLVVILTHHMIS